MYQNLTTNSKSFIKRFSHSKRFEVAIRLLDLRLTDKFLDYGTGDGYVIILLDKMGARPCSITGFEPDDYQYAQLIQNLATMKINARPVSEIEEIKKNKYNKISCLEVLEHFDPATLSLSLDVLNKILEDQGVLIISVPIETGLSGFLKNIIRIIIGQTHDNTNSKTILKSLLGIKIERENSSYIGSHIGFNHKNLEKYLLNHGFQIEEKVYSPLPLVRGFVNSQVFYVLKKHELDFINGQHSKMSKI